MKKIKTFAAILLTVSLAKYSSAQIYMTNTGNVSIGSTYTPPSTAIGQMVLGDALFIPQSITPTQLGSNSAPLIFGTNGYSKPAQADYTWWYDGGTGMYHPGSGSLGFTTSGNQIAGLTSSGWGEVNFYNWNTSTSQYPLAVTSYLNANTSITWNVETYNGSTYNHNFYVYGNGSVWATNSYNLSDARLKENINNISDALNKVMQLRGVNYTFIADRNNSPKIQMGLIAQEVEKVVPEVVGTGADGYKGIEYQNLVGLLIEAVKAEKYSIDSLKNQLNSCCGIAQGVPAIQNSTVAGAALYQNVPNPFSQNTTISCVIPVTANSHSLMIFNMNGALVKTISIEGTGNQSIVINGSSLSAGMYYYTLVVDGKEVDTKKMILTQ